MNAMKPKHIGRNISRIRELKDMKQEALAQAMGVSQQTISNLENSEIVDEEKLQEVAKALGVNAEAIKNFSEEAAINFFTNFYDNSNGAVNSSHISFNPIDKVVELYERLLEAEKEKVGYLERFIDKNSK